MRLSLGRVHGLLEGSFYPLDRGSLTFFRQRPTFHRWQYGFDLMSYLSSIIMRKHCIKLASQLATFYGLTRTRPLKPKESLPGYVFRLMSTNH